MQDTIIDSDNDSNEGNVSKQLSQHNFLKKLQKLREKNRELQEENHKLEEENHKLRLDNNRLRTLRCVNEGRYL